MRLLSWGEEGAGLAGSARIAGGRALAAAWPLLFVCLHALALLLVPDRAWSLSLAFLIAAPLLAAGACLRRARRADGGHGWTAAALAMLLWAGGMAGNVVAAAMLADSSGVGSLSMLLFVLYGVPLIFALASPDRDPWRVRLVDGALSLALGYLFFHHTFAFATMTGASDQGVLSLRLMFDIENLFVALFALARHLASSEPGRRAFFGALDRFAICYLLVAAYINHFQADSDYGSLSDPVIAVPFLLLAALALQPDRPRRADGLPGKAERVVLAASPLMLPATLLAVSAALVWVDPRMAMAGCAVAILGYGLRSVLMLVRNLDTQERLERLSRVDALTGLANRRHFDETLRREWARAMRGGEGVALLMIDVDHFKQLNDTFGHPVGDQRLREVARALAQCVARASDLVARYGGEEFAAILPSTDSAQARALAETMRTAVERLALPSPRGRVTVSIGIGHARSIDGASLPDLLEAADGALYTAKAAGRNRVAAA